MKNSHSLICLLNGEQHSTFLEDWEILEPEDLITAGSILHSKMIDLPPAIYFKALLKIAHSEYLPTNYQALSIWKFFQTLEESSVYIRIDKASSVYKENLANQFESFSSLFKEKKPFISLNLQEKISLDYQKSVNLMLEQLKSEEIVYEIIGHASDNLAHIKGPASMFGGLTKEEYEILKNYRKIENFDEIAGIFLKVDEEIKRCRSAYSHIVFICYRLLCYGLEESKRLSHNLELVLKTFKATFNRNFKTKIMKAYKTYCVNEQIETEIKIMKNLCNSNLDLERDVRLEIEEFDGKKEGKLRNLFIEIEMKGDSEILGEIILGCLKYKSLESCEVIENILLKMEFDDETIKKVQNEIKFLKRKQKTEEIKVKKEKFQIRKSPTVVFIGEPHENSSEAKKPSYFIKNEFTNEFTENALLLIKNKRLGEIPFIFETSFRILEEKIKEKLPNAIIETIGSVKEGTWIPNSEIDILLTAENLFLSNLLGLIYYKLKNIGWIIKHSCNSTREELKITDKKSNITYKIHLNTPFSSESTSLISAYTSISPLVPQMILYIKHWASFQFYDEIESPLSGFVISLLVIHFLQNEQPALLPNLQGLFYTPVFQKGYDTGFARPFKWVSENSKSLGQLITEFFQYFSSEIQTELTPITINPYLTKSNSQSAFPVLHPFSHTLLTPHLTHESQTTFKLFRAFQSTYESITSHRFPLSEEDKCAK